MVVLGRRFDDSASFSIGVLVNTGDTASFSSRGFSAVRAMSIDPPILQDDKISSRLLRRFVIEE